MFGKINVEKTKGSLIVRNEIIEKLYNEFGVRFGYSFNDLYGVKEGVVRRLKGRIWSDEMYRRGEMNNMKLYNELFNKVKEYLENLEFEGFKIELNKLNNYSWSDYMWSKRRGFEGSFLDYKEKSIYNEGTCILKIKWEC
jgi:hypothetical protein